MRVGIIGAPMSGKTELAKGLSEKFDLKIIDGYAEKWAERSDLTIGFTGGYAHTLGLTLDRIYEERRTEDNFVTCGTIVDGLMYMAIMSLANPNEIEFARAKAYIEMMSFLFFDFWKYDHVFVCRLDNPNPPKEEETPEYLQAKFEFDQAFVLDNEIPMTIKAFERVETFELPSANRLEAALEEINRVSN